MNILKPWKFSQRYPSWGAEGYSNRPLYNEKTVIKMMEDYKKHIEEGGEKINGHHSGYYHSDEGTTVCDFFTINPYSTSATNCYICGQEKTMHKSHTG